MLNIAPALRRQVFEAVQDGVERWAGLARRAVTDTGLIRPGTRFDVEASWAPVKSLR